MLVADQLGVPIEDIEVIHGDTDVVPRGVGHMRVPLAPDRRRRRPPGRHRRRREGARSSPPTCSRRHPRTSSSTRARAVPRRRHPGARAQLGRARGGRLDRERQPLMAEVDLDVARADVPVRDPPLGRRSRHRDRQGDAAPPHRRRRRRQDPQPACSPRGRSTAGSPRASAQALLEEFVYDDEGNPLTSTLADYAFISAAELPSYETRFTETPTPLNPLGAKGIGESGTIGSTPAVQNAVVDALAHLGVRHVDMPTTPTRVWRAIQAAIRHGLRPRGADVRMTINVNGTSEKHDVEPRTSARALSARRARPDRDEHRL